ncbi:TPA: hypothetical protein RJJ49_002139 [Staphylococcus pseudintermedius]|nr:hypothetical protein [Staphylococcus pseudintermedius]ELD8081450.1 hypothetical protein [Staphylococcus pseudintermedius]HDV6058298.1 hypothetical protein [Staphylococcus pseudintermedius]
MNLDNISMYFKLNAPVVIYDLDFLLTHIEKLKKEVPNKIKVLYVNSGLKMLFYGGLKMSFFGGLRMTYV